MVIIKYFLKIDVDTQCKYFKERSFLPSHAANLLSIKKFE